MPSPEMLTIIAQAAIPLALAVIIARLVNHRRAGVPIPDRDIFGLWGTFTLSLVLLYATAVALDLAWNAVPVIAITGGLSITAIIVICARECAPALRARRQSPEPPEPHGPPGRSQLRTPVPGPSPPTPAALSGPQSRAAASSGPQSRATPAGCGTPLLHRKEMTPMTSDPQTCRLIIESAEQIPARYAPPEYRPVHQPWPVVYADDEEDLQPGPTPVWRRAFNGGSNVPCWLLPSPDGLFSVGAAGFGGPYQLDTPDGDSARYENAYDAFYAAEQAAGAGETRRRSRRADADDPDDDLEWLLLREDEERGVAL